MKEKQPTLAQQVALKRREIVMAALVKTGGNRSRAAAELGLSARQMFRIVAEELTDHDLNVIVKTCSDSGTLDPKSLAGGVRA